MKTIRIHLDAHVHVYPFHDVPRLLLAALDHMPSVAPTDLRVLCLAERADCSFFQALAQDEIRLPGDRWRIAAWDPDGGVKIRHLPDHRDLWILAGRQAAAAERIEVCALFSDEPLADGRPARELVRAIQAAGGLPVGTSGRALNLLSGGIDSPVAAWCMARRGLALHHIHFASPPYTSLRAKLKVRDLARELVEYTGNCTLFVVPYTKPQEYIRDNAPDVLFTVLMRRSMLRIANRVAAKLELQALITGESLAQVASQTMAALACTDAAQDLPVLRPCIGMDKTEIIAISRKIGTFETSIEPYEDCCTIFTPPHPKSSPTMEEILAAEAGMPDLLALEAEAAENVEKIYIRMGGEEDDLL